MPELSMKALVSALAVSLVARASLARQVAPPSEYHTGVFPSMQIPPLSEELVKSLRGRYEKAAEVKPSQEGGDNNTQSISKESAELTESELREDELAESVPTEDEEAFAAKSFQIAQQGEPAQPGEQTGDLAKDAEQSVRRSEPVELRPEEMEAQMIPSQGEEVPPEGEPSQQSDPGGDSPSDSVMQTKQTVSWVDQSMLDPSGSQQPELSPDELEDEMMEGQEEPPPVGGYTRAKAELMIAQASQELHGIDKEAVAKMKDASQYQTNTEAYQEAGDLIQAAKEDLANARPLSPAKSLEASYRQAEAAHKDVARLAAISVNEVMFAM